MGYDGNLIAVHDGGNVGALVKLVKRRTDGQVGLVDNTIFLENRDAVVAPLYRYEWLYHQSHHPKVVEEDNRNALKTALHLAE